MTSTHYVISKRILKNTKDIIKKKKFVRLYLWEL